MHATTTTAALSLFAFASSALANTSYRLRAFSTDNDNILDWAVLNAHVAAGENALEVQRPSAFTSDEAVINGTASEIADQKARLSFPLGLTYPYFAHIPEHPEGTLTQITTTPNNGTKAFAVEDGNLLAYGEKEGFWICSQNVAGNEVFVLWYGLNPKQENLPSDDCMKVRLQANES